MADPHAFTTFSETTQMEFGFDASEKYERGLVLRKAGLFTQAIEEFEQAAGSRTHALKAYAHIGLCYTSSRRYKEAVAAFRRALTCSKASAKETVQILYVLGRTLETLGRIDETLEAYRWIRREDPDYRDVEHRIQQLSTRRVVSRGTHPAQQSWVSGVLQSWQELLRPSK